ncbi:DUF7660 family protein [Gynuella sunshinyii]|uniref:DUF7660 domain-containing protein n=1 Tax=Gynuella sunshinyii YC6258 TaxID=1445510 RepID=A0A0C5VL98_9GAMM|nr:hypothetical protein [Gynuella sunshinyii]AJQ95081.1 hypothetical Protein YC6258_03043 [Gynuella sunshinyii YC6258]
MMKLHDLIEIVDDENSFLAFVEALKKDRENAIALEKKNPSSPHDSDAGGWENVTIESFLEAAHAWAIDSDFGASQGLSSDNIWKKMATFLYCGKIYE